MRRMNVPIVLILPVGLVAAAASASGQRPVYGPARPELPPVRRPLGRLAGLTISRVVDPAADLGVPTDLELVQAAGFSPEEYAAQPGGPLRAIAVFGSKALADAYEAGDRFDRAEVLEKARRWRGAGEFVVPGARYSVLTAPGLDPARDGIDLAVAVPLPVDTPTIPLPGPATPEYDGPVAGAWVCDADAEAFAPGGAGGPPRPCTAEAAAAARARGEAVYRAQAATSRVVVHVVGDIATLKELARNEEVYRVHLLFRGLRPDPLDAWGWYREDALEAERWNTRSLIVEHDLGLDRGEMPKYAVVRSRSAGDVVAGRTGSTHLGVVLADVDGQVIGTGAFSWATAGR